MTPSHLLFPLHFLPLSPLFFSISTFTSDKLLLNLINKKATKNYNIKTITIQYPTFTLDWRFWWNAAHKFINLDTPYHHLKNWWVSKWNFRCVIGNMQMIYTVVRKHIVKNFPKRKTKIRSSDLVINQRSIKMLSCLNEVSLY